MAKCETCKTLRGFLQDERKEKKLLEDQIAAARESSRQAKQELNTFRKFIDDVCGKHPSVAAVMKIERDKIKQSEINDNVRRAKQKRKDNHSGW